jgi:signal transduction histidine kinase
MIALNRPRSRSDNIFKRSNYIVMAFALILAILVTATAVILYQVNKTHNHLETVVNKNYIKTELLAQLKEYIRLRQIGLRDMMIVNDPFIKDEYKTQFYQYATNVTLVRDEFINQGISREEEILTDKIRDAMTAAYPLQNALADKIIFTDHVENLQGSLNETFLKQKIVMDYINQLEGLIKEKNSQAISNAIKLQDNSIFIITVVGLISFLLGTVITITLIRINKNQEQLVLDTLSKLEHTNENLEEIVSERTSELQAAKLKAEAANEEKSMFLSRMSHELRTPLNAVLGFNQLLHEDINQPYLEDEDKHTYISNIAKAGHHLLRLVNDVLDLSRIEQGKFELKMSETDISQSIVDSIELMRPMATENNIAINYYFNCDKLYAMLDKNRFEQVILNLISNAIKYNTKNGSIEIDCTGNNGQAIISIKDNGIGIDKDDIDVIFKPFNRLYLATVANEGTGVGLSLSKYLIEEMGGNIGASSEVGKGSTFWITVDILDNANLSNNEQQTEDIVDSLNVLYIEDDVDNINLLQEITKSLSTQINYHAAMTFSLATDLALTNEFDYILVDINDVSLDIASLSKIKNENNNGTKIIGLVSDKDGLSETNRLYFDEIISKPFNMNVVRNIFQPQSNNNPA